MKRLFKISLFGYRRKQVKGYVLSLRKDYEQELSKKKDRMFELNSENRELKAKLREYQEKLSQYEEQELFISKALVKAEESAQAIMKECYHKIDVEKYKITQEKEKWRTREKEIMKQLLTFQNEAYELMESFQSEINYLTSKDLASKDLGQLQVEDKPRSQRQEDEDILSVSSI